MTVKSGSRSGPGLPPVVLKIGGSILRHAGALKPITEILSKAKRPVAVVTGGGIFADAVRDAQKQIGFDDLAAHKMAIVAMHQNAILLSSMLPSFAPLAAISDVSAAFDQGRQVLWLPLAECKDDPDLPASWDVTSDAIAVRLAERLGGLKLGILKSRAAAGAPDPQSLTDEGLIDPVAARLLQRSGLPFEIIENSDTTSLARFLRTGEIVDAADAT